MSETRPPRRWRRRLIAVLLVLLVGLAAAIQIVIWWTDIPRNIAQKQINSQTGLLITIDTLKLGIWRGRTTMTGVAVHAPGEAQPVAVVDRITAEHYSILSMLIGRGVGLSDITINEPVVDLKQYPDGRWNIEPLIQQILQLSDDDSASSPKPLELPGMKVTDGRINASLRDGRALSIWPVTGELHQPRISGLPGSSTEVRFALADMLFGQGSFVAMAPFEHTATLDVNHLKQLAPWLEPELFVHAFQGQIHWAGRVEKDQLQGEARFQQLTASGGMTAQAPAHSVAVDGAVALTAGRQITLSPDKLRLISSVLPEPVTLMQGQVKWTTAQTLQIHNLQLATFSGMIGLAGDYTPATQAGQARIDWRDLSIAPISNQQGSASVNLTRQGTLGQLRVQAQIHSAGQLASSQWESQWLATLIGQSWDRFDWTIEIPQAAIRQDQQTLSITQGLLRGSLNQQLLTLRDINLPVTPANLPDVSITGHGQYDLQQRSGSVSADLHSRTATAADGSPASASVQLKGDERGIEATLRDLHFDTLTGQASGSVRWDALNQIAASFDLRATPPANVMLPVQFTTGSVTGKVEGQFQPLNVRLTGQAIVHEPRTPQATPPLQDVVINLTGQATDQLVTLESRSFQLLDGWMTLQARHQFTTGQSEVQLKADRLPLASLDILLHRPAQLTGLVNLELTAGITNADPQTLDVSGRWNAVNIEHPLLHPTQAAGRIVFKDGAVTLLDILAESGQGRARGSIRSPMMELNQLVTTLSLEDWPIRWAAPGEYKAHATGQASITGNLLTGDYSGPADLKIALLKNDAAVMETRIRSTLKDHVLDVHALEGKVLDGTITGQARVNLKDITQSHADLQLADVDLSRLQLLASSAQGLIGRAQGKITLTPATGREALGPLRLDIALVPTEAHLHRLELNELQSRIYIDRQRVVVHHLDLAMARGKLHAWGRVSRQQDEWFGFLQSQWTDLSFDQLASLMLVVQTPATAGKVASEYHAGRDEQSELMEDDQPVPGLFNGKMIVTGPLHDWTKASGHGDVVVRQSDLVRVPVLKQIYGLFNIVGSSSDPEGYGHANFRLEGPSFVITDAGYINRGVSISLRLRLTDLRQGKHTPITGVAMAIFNPLPALPGAQRYVDAIMNYQGAVTTLSITGHLDHHQVQRVPATFIGQITRDLLSTPAHAHDNHLNDTVTPPTTEPAPLPDPSAATTQEAVRP